MRYRLFGRTGLRVSEVSLGTMTFGQEVAWGASRDESKRIFDAYVEAGGNFVDTAINYTRGTSESYVGEFIAAERGRFVVGTKYTMNNPVGDPNVAGSHRKNMVQSLESSLRRLKTDYLDIYWIHAHDLFTPAEELMRALDDVVRSGKVLYVGVSNTPAWFIAQANTLADLRGWTPFAGIQISYSLIERTPERDLIPMARSLGLSVTAWAPLASGLLTGKYDPSQAASTTRRLDVTKVVPIDERNLGIVAAVREVASEIGCRPSDVALAWVRQMGAIPVLGARTLEQMRENLASLDVEIPAEAMQRLNEVSQIDLGYPHEFLARPNIVNSVYAGMFGAVISDR